MSARALVGLALALALTRTGRAEAHTLSDGYVELALDGATIRGRVDLAARDLHDAVGLDADGDGRLRWREVEAGAGRVRAYVASHLALTTRAGACALSPGALSALERPDGVHVAIELAARCPGPASPLTIDYRAVFALDARHRGLVHVAGPGGSATAIVRGPGPVTLVTGDGVGVAGFVADGVWHIWLGLDHVCFLLALLLPAVLRRSPGGWRPRAGLGEVVREVAGVVTAFTLAHSLTLALAAMGWLRLPSRLIETAIALSVAVVALANVIRGLDTRWPAAFVLGLVHGFGFAGALGGLALPGPTLVAALFAFNLGVELGQAALVAAFLPLAFALRRTRLYPVVLVIASLAMAALALRWSLARAFG